MRRHLPLALLASALIAAGCGGGSDSGSSGGNGAGGGTSTPSSTDDGGTSSGGASEGKTVFASTCGSCHTLAAAETSGTFGPSLDELKPDKARVLAAIAEGPGQMPEDLLQGQEAETVAEYVASSAGG